MKYKLNTLYKRITVDKIGYICFIAKERDLFTRNLYYIYNVEKFHCIFNDDILLSKLNFLNKKIPYIECNEQDFKFLIKNVFTKKVV